MSVNAREQLPDPIIMVNSTFDLLLFIVVVDVILTVWLFNILKNDDQAMTINYRIGRLSSIHNNLSNRKDYEKYNKRIKIILNELLMSFWYFIQHIGNHIAQSSVFIILAFLLIATNFYSTGIEFNFLLFNANWFFAFLIDIFLLGIPILYMTELLYKIRLFSNN